MAYAAVEDLSRAVPEAELVRLTDDSASGAVDEVKAREAVDSAAEEIDAYIGGRTALPIAGTVPPILGKLNVDLAVYNLYSRLAREVPPVWAERRREAVRLLERIADGRVSLGLQPEPPAPDEGDYAAGMKVAARTRVFSEDDLDRY